MDDKLTLRTNPLWDVVFTDELQQHANRYEREIYDQMRVDQQVRVWRKTGNGRELGVINNETKGY